MRVEYARSYSALSVDVLSARREAQAMQTVQRFAANLRGARLAKGLTQEALADAAELHRTHISLLEKAKRDPKLTTIAKLADGLDTTPGELLRGVSDPHEG
jgi:DNA-binding XRE family transcriptional regulator